MTTAKGGIVIATAFVAIAICLGGVLPLWLDEIIQLRETRNTTPAQLIAALPGQPGAAPLGYLTQQFALGVTGYSVRMARLPSALFIAGTIFLTAILAADLGMAKPWLASVLLALMPIVLRYACESRIYTQALFFSTLATVLFMRLMKSEGFGIACLYYVTLACAVYSQPYAIFIAPAHILYALITGNRRTQLLTTAAAIAALASFLPWYFYAKAIWMAGIAGGEVRFVATAKTPLMLFREIAGAGYWGSGLLLILWVIAARRSVFLWLCIGIPVILALTADALFGYFVATRQILWVLPAVAILAASALERQPRIAIPVAAIFAAFCLFQSYRNFTSPREDWQLAADTISTEVARGACLMVVPPEQQYSYAFFRPELAKHPCPAPHTVVAFTPYATPAERAAANASLAAAGYQRRSATEAGRTDVVIFSQ